MAEKWIKGVENIMKYVAAKNGERVLVLSEDPIGRMDKVVVEALAKMARDAGGDVSVMYTKPFAVGGGGEPSDIVRQAWFASELVIVCSGFPILYTRTNFEALMEHGVRCLEIMGGMANRESFSQRGPTSDPRVCAVIADYLAEKLFGEKEVRMTSKQGMNFSCLTPPGFMFAQCKGGIQAGSLTPLRAGNWAPPPWQMELIFWPRETANGVIYFDSFYGIGWSEDPIICHFKDGWCTKIESGGPKSKADQLIEILAPFAGPPDLLHPANRHCTEFATGVDPSARIYMKEDDLVTIEAERNCGVAHVAIGSRRVGNPPLGRPEFVCGIHLDGTILEPTVTIAGETLIEDGWATYLNDPVLQERIRELGEDPDVVLKQERKVIK